MLAPGADVARDLRQLLGRDEHAIVALVFEVQVVARDLGDRARLKAGEPRDAVILVHDDVPRAQLGERAQRPAADAPWSAASGLARRHARALGATAAQQAMLGEDRELQLGSDEALAQRRGGEAQRGLEHLTTDVHVLAQPRGLHAPEVVGRPLALAAAGERHDRAVAGAHELLELGLGLGQRARGGIGGLGPQLQRLFAGDRRQPDSRPPGECGFDVLGAHIQVMRVRVGERGADVGPMVAEHGLQLLLRGDEQLGVIIEQVQQRAEPLDGQQLGDVRAIGLVFGGRHLRQLAVLDRELRRGRDLDV